MSRSISVTLAMALLLPLGVSAQAHQHGGQAGGATMPSDSSRAGTMRMPEHMMQMHEQMQHMAQMRAGVSLLLGGVTDLGLTEAQTSSLQAILEKARSDALETLTPEQRQKLEAAPSTTSMCPRAQPPTGPGG